MRFHIGAILTVVTGRMLCRPVDLYSILNYMTGDNLFTHQLSRAARVCGPVLAAQLPEVAAVKIPDVCTWDTANELAAVHGAMFEVAPLQPNAWERIDPVSGRAGCGVSVHKCAACGRSDVRLYRGYGGFLRADEITCNEHLPTRPSARAERRARARLCRRNRWGARRVPPQPAPEPRTAWRVPLIEAPDGSVWGYTSCPDVDIDRWAALPDASPYAPTWSQGAPGRPDGWVTP